jgi:dimethylhistidine N-methyltransferase
MKILDLAPNTGDFLAEALAGLRASPATLPCKYFYDAEGAALFEQICELPEYYPTRTELTILRSNLAEIAALIGPHARIVEYGSGAGEKIRMLLDTLEQPAVYTPIDISREQLLNSADLLQQDYPQIEVLPVCADYVTELTLPVPATSFSRSVVFFPGSTIGNFTPSDARAFLQRFYRLCQQGQQPGLLLLGYDLKKDPATLEAAYNDSQGVTAEFNLNLLRRINQELDGEFDISQWRHEARWNENSGAVEMHLISLQQQQAKLNGDTFHFTAGETIHTENSFKYHASDMQKLAADAGFNLVKGWTDSAQHFQVQLFEAKAQS